MDLYERSKNKDTRVIICGAGIVGCSTAYYLALRGVRSVLVERHEVGSCASGKAGGFLTRDWCDDYEWGEFARLSFDIHSGLDAEAPFTDYRRMDAISISVGIEEDVPKPREPAKSESGLVYVPDGDEGKEEVKPDAEKDAKSKPLQDCATGGAAFLSERRNSSAESDLRCVPEWIDGNVTYATRTGNQRNVAQVHPRKLCKLLVEKCGASVDLMTGHTITGFVRNGARVTGVRLEKKGEAVESVYGNYVVIAMGPWSLNALQWLGLPPMIGSCRGHSLILRPSDPDWLWLTPTAVFAEMRDSDGKEMCMEIYPRPDKTVYVCGFSEFLRLPASGDSVVPNESSIWKLRDNLGQVSSILARSTVEVSQACVMPKSSDDRFIIGAVPGLAGAFIGSAHSYWGILCGPATGLALSHLIVDGHCDVLDLTPFNPSRFFSSPRR